MIQRGTLIAVLFGVEIALVAMMVQAIAPGAQAPWHDAAVRDFHGSDAAAAAAPADYKFTTGAQPEVVVDIDYADLTVYRRDEPGITVNITRDGWVGLGSKAPEISANQVGDTVHVTVAPTSALSLGDNRMVTIAVAPNTRLTVAHAGNIKVTGLRAEASVNSVGNGSISVEDFNGPSLQVSTSNGRLTLRNIVAPLLEVDSSNGRVEGTALQLRDGHIDSSNGRVRLSFAPGADTTVTAETSNGHVNASGLTAVGTQRVKSGSDDEDDDDDSTTSKTVRVGAGRGRLDVHTSNGSINLSQEG